MTPYNAVREDQGHDHLPGDGDLPDLAIIIDQLHVPLDCRSLRRMASLRITSLAEVLGVSDCRLFLLVEV